ncbi:hypothetical protein BHYA_0019g00270 [Botrytis hyacinthi]|uniref:Uncharacterized protein n=1 Tax=Botrytis hyacinthi TaxID=278943 RepID=A0A4Z1GYM2_9HELO|nr:hypothetical protein BHYA_0019g00270 [Botrytis hyacinthi]
MFPGRPLSRQESLKSAGYHVCSSAYDTVFCLGSQAVALANSTIVNEQQAWALSSTVPSYTTRIETADEV